MNPELCLEDINNSKLTHLLVYQFVSTRGKKTRKNERRLMEELGSLDEINYKIVQLQMTDNSKTKIKEYQFSLVRLRPECKVQPTFVDFEPLYGGASSSGSIIPAFNSDRCHFTPAFLLPTDKKTHPRDPQTEKLLFEHRVRQSISDSNKQKIEDHAPSSNYCQICQEHFKNYDQHLEQKTHLLRWHHNEFNHDIHQLCLQLEDSESLSSLTPKRKLIKKKDKSYISSNAFKASPKTTIDNDLQRKISLTSEEVSLGIDLSDLPLNI